MKELRFGAVYGAPPIFNPDFDTMGYVDVLDLGLPSHLVDEINIWDQCFQKTFCDAYPPGSGFDSIEKMVRHNIRGAEIALLLQKALGSDVLVKFIPLR